MRLSLVISSLAGGGAERAVSEMANHWASRAITVSIITWCGGSEVDAYALHAGIRRARLDVRGEQGSASRPSRVLRRIRELRREFLEHRPDVILSFVDSTNVVALLAARGLEVPVVIAERSAPAANLTLSSPWRLLRRITYRRADRVVAQTRAAARWLDEHCGTTADVIPNVLRALPAARTEDPESARSPVVLAVGRLAWEKDLGTLIRAFAMVHGAHRDWTLVLLGEGPLREELQAQVRELGIADAVRFEGFRPDPEAWMARAAIFVLSSRFEGYPNALLEAMAMGAAVVSSDCPSGPREIIREGVDGRMFAVGEVAALASLLRELMDDAPQRRRLGTAARGVRERHAPDRIMQLWDGLLQDAVRGRS